MAADFKKAVDELCEGISHAQLAKALRVSVATVRQARLPAGAKAHRSPPAGWKKRVSLLAEQRAERLQRLAKSLQGAKYDV